VDSLEGILGIEQQNGILSKPVEEDPPESYWDHQRD
jgi:hypothetical protein